MNPAVPAPPAPPPSRRHRALRLTASVGRSLYLAVIQGLTGLVFLGLALYLAVNSPSAARIVSEVATQVLPGSLQVRTLHLGPVLRDGELRVRLRASRLEVREPAGAVVLAADRLVAELAPARLIDGLRQGALRLSLPRLDLVRPLIVLDNDAKGRLRLVTAFADPDEPPKPDAKPMPVSLRLGHAKVKDATFRLDLPAIQISGKQLDFELPGAEIAVPIGGPPQVSYALRRVTAGSAEVAMDSMRLMPKVPAASLQIDEIDGDLQRVIVDGLSMQMPPVDWRQALAEPDTLLSRARIEVDMGAELEVRGSKLGLVTSSHSPFIRDLLGDLFKAQAAVNGEFRFNLGDGFAAEGQIAGTGLMAGFVSEAVNAKVRVETGARGDSLVRVVTTDLQLRAYGGQLSSERIDYKMDLRRPEHTVRGVFHLDGMRGDLPLLSQAVKLEGITPQLAAGRLYGSLGTAVRVHLPTGQPLDMDVALDADLRLERDAFLAFIGQALPKVEWRGGMRFEMGPGKDGGYMRVAMDKSRLRAEDNRGGGELLLDLDADGVIDLMGGETKLALSLWMPRMEAWLAPLGLPGYAGALRLEAGRMSGAMMAWDAGGAATVSDIVTPWVRIRRASAKMSLVQGLLVLKNLAVSTEFGDATGEFDMALFGRTWAELRQRQPLNLRNLHMPALDLAKAQTALKLTALPKVAGLLEIRDGKVSMDAKNPKTTMQLSAQLSARHLEVAGEHLEALQGRVALNGQRAEVQDGRLRRRGGAADGREDLKLSGYYHLGNGSFGGEVQVPPVQLASMPAMGDLPMRGEVGLTATARGDAGGLEIEADVVAKELGWAEIPIGSAQLHISKSRNGPMLFSSQEFFAQFKLMEGSQIEFTGMKPQMAQVRVATVGSIDPIRRMGLEKLPGMQVRLEGEVITTLNLAAQPLDWKVEAAVPSGGLWVDLGGGVRPIRNTSVARGMVTPKAITLESTYFEVEGTPLEMCGSLIPQDDGKPMHLLAFVAGTLAVPRWGPLAESLASMDVKLDILSDPLVNADRRSECLQAAAGRLRLEGGLGDDPLKVQGVVRTHASTLVMRGLGEMTIAEGARLYLATNTKGVMSLLIPFDQPLAMHLMDGDLTTHGSARLQGNQLLSMDLQAEGRELLVAKPKEYQLSVAPQVTLVGTEMDDPENRSITLKGRVKITDGTVSKAFNATTEVIANVTDRKVESYSKPLTETMPLLAEVQMDLDVVLQGIEVTSRVSAVKCDVVADGALKVGGTLMALELRNNINVVEGSGSQVSVPYNNLVFDVERGVLEFEGDPSRPLIDAMARIDIPVKAGSRSSSTATLSVSSELTSDNTQSTEIVQVFVGIKGHWGEKDMALKFSSNKGDSEADVQCLLAFRRRCNDEGGPGMRLTTDFLIGDTVNRAVLAVFQGLVDTLTFDFDALNLGFNAEVVKKFGKNISMGTRVQTGKENRYDADFSFRITDRLSLNGLWRRTRPLDTSTNSQTTIDTYESKLRYKVILDD